MNLNNLIAIHRSRKRYLSESRNLPLYELFPSNCFHYFVGCSRERLWQAKRLTLYSGKQKTSKTINNVGKQKVILKRGREPDEELFNIFGWKASLISLDKGKKMFSEQRIERADQTRIIGWVWKEMSWIVSRERKLSQKIVEAGQKEVGRAVEPHSGDCAGLLKEMIINYWKLPEMEC